MNSSELALPNLLSVKNSLSTLTSVILINSFSSSQYQMLLKHSFSLIHCSEIYCLYFFCLKIPSYNKKCWKIKFIWMLGKQQNICTPKIRFYLHFIFKMSKEISYLMKRNIYKVNCFIYSDFIRALGRRIYNSKYDKFWLIFIFQTH